MSRIFWDTNLFIYLFEGSAERSARVADMRERMLERGDELYSSTLTLGEILVKPLETGNRSLATQYEEILGKVCILLPFGPKEALLYAQLRQDRSIRPPDVIQLSCASSAGMDLFITNDARLSQKRISGIQFICSLANAPL